MRNQQRRLRLDDATTYGTIVAIQDDLPLTTSIFCEDGQNDNDHDNDEEVSGPTKPCPASAGLHPSAVHTAPPPHPYPSEAPSVRTIMTSRPRRTVLLRAFVVISSIGFFLLRLHALSAVASDGIC
jgi:hypothetical protein